MKDINRLRYADDNTSDYLDHLVENRNTNSIHRMHLLSTSLKVTADISPRIFHTIQNIMKQLNILDIHLECYVYNDPEMNASCFSLGNEVEVIIMVSSGLVNNLKEDEFAFVIGHEIGHFIFGHLDYIRPEKSENALLNLKWSHLYQAQEISADRIGLICSGSIESSIRAIIKTVSGLDDSFITRNLHGYLHQIKSLKYDSLANNNQTHPIFPIRAKALTLFTMSELYYWWLDESKRAPLSIENLTNKIRKDLESTTLKNLKNESDDIVEQFKLWFFVKSFIEDSTLDEEETLYLRKIFGEVTANKAIAFAQSNPNAINKKYEEYRIQMSFLPKTYQMLLLNEMKELIRNIVSSHAIHKYFNNIERSIVGNG